MARFLLLCCLFAAALTSSLTEAGDDNGVYSPCSDSTVAIGDGFTFGIAFAAKDSFFGTNRSVQYSPCDRRHLSLNGNSELAVFRPKVDEITLLTINTSSSSSSFRPVRSHLLIYLGEFRVLIRLGKIRSILPRGISYRPSIGSEFLCPD